jgi:Zn-dependent M16 (insulinase) family peptidase
MKYYAIAMTLFAAAASAQPGAVSYANLAEGQTLNGFKTVALYLDGADRPMGARFRHQKSGFTLDLLRIQTVPQTFIWTTSYPTSNMGEPHTQEHLLLGKGDKGRALASAESMALISSSAFTMQYKTCYFFYSPAGPDVFFQHFERTMDALLHPDYTDEEIRREVRNFGVSPDPKDGSLRVEEKGTVYAEMVSSMDQAGSRLYRAAGRAIYGNEHPLAYNSGGLPEALRILQPADIRKFHREHYFLGNMGAVVSLPKDVDLPAALARMDASLARLESRAPSFPVVTENKLPKPVPAPAGRIEFAEYPFRNDQQPGSVVMVWPAERKLGNRDLTLFSLFLSNVAGGADTDLYKRFIDSRSKDSEFGAKGVSASVDNDLGNPVYLSFRDVPVSRMNEASLAELRAKALDEFAKVAAWPDGSPELAAFNSRLKGRILEERRQLSKFVNSPPGFGFRSTSSGWMEHLDQLNKQPGFRKSLTEKEDLEAIEKLLASDRNIWRDRLAEWKITGVTPNVVGSKPNPALIRQAQQEREERVAAEVARLKQKYGAATDQDAIRRFSVEYEAATAELEKTAAKTAPPKFIDSPPMTLDDQLEFQGSKLGAVPLVASTFDSMTSATAGLSLRLDGIPENRLSYISLLPQLLTGVGVIENGQPVSYEQMSQRLRNEILSLNASFSVNATTDRYELTLRGSGNNLAESKRALEWMKLTLFHPDWRMENLPRIRDLVDQAIGSLRATTQRAEESWVNDPAQAWRRQDNPLLLSTSSFMTRAHNLHRLRWQLKEGGTPAVESFLRDLGKAEGARAERKALAASIREGKYAPLEKLNAAERALAEDAAKDLDALLADIPDSSISADWAYLCDQMAAGLETGPRNALATLDEIRRSLLLSGGARMFLISAADTRQALTPGLQELAGMLETGAPKKASYAATQRVAGRLLQREPQAAKPLFAGLLNANSQGGVFLHSALATSYQDASREKLLDYLASNVYAGHGAHGIFMKTWAAGLAYSNGIRVSLPTGRLSYYAERTPELPQTLKFVINELTRAKFDPALTDYAIAGAFEGTRAASPYEDRGESMAADLADGLTPEVVTRFHKAILELRKDPKLGDELFKRMNAVYGRVLPGMNVKAASVPGGVFLVIGPEQQLAAWESYLKTADSPDARVWRLYPRDFWLTE